MSENKKQVMSETKISFDGEELVTSVSNEGSNTTVTTTVDGAVISVAKEKTPQDVLDQGEQKNVSYPCFDALEVPITELIDRKTEILNFLIKPVVDGHLIKNAECLRENHKYIFTIFYECRWML